MKKKSLISQTAYNIILIILSLIVIFPLVLVVSASFSTEKDLVEYGYALFPKNVDLSAYKYVFKNPESILNAYKVTFIFSVAAMVLSVLFMSMIAYPLSKSRLKGKRFISFYLYFTMLFSGGLVPSYILITQYLNLGNTIWVYILPGMISPWYVFMMRTFFQGIPESLAEAAYIDGASELRVYFTIIIPLSKPVLSTVALFMFLAKWNDWYTAMLYITDESLISLQYLLQRIMENIRMLQEMQPSVSGLVNTADIPSETARMAMAVVVAGPALLVFPFFQKYFVKGLTVGGVKG